MIPHIWHRYPEKDRRKYEKFLEWFGSLAKLFNQKSSSDIVPCLVSKFQETVFFKCFTDRDAGINSEDIDTANTPHDIRSTFSNGDRVGIGLKTWRPTGKSFKTYQKVAQLKADEERINKLRDKAVYSQNSSDKMDLVSAIASDKNRHLTKDYIQRKLNPKLSVYNYVVRIPGQMQIRETNYPTIKIDQIDPDKIHFQHGNKKDKRGNYKVSSVDFYDGIKHYRYHFADSQCYMQFDATSKDHVTLAHLPVTIMSDPFSFIANAFIANNTNKLTYKSGLIVPKNSKNHAVYLPLYSYKKKGHKKLKYINKRSGLNESLGAPKNKGSHQRRPEYEIYIPVPQEFRKYNKYWFNPHVNLMDHAGYKQNTGHSSYHFWIHMPDGYKYKSFIGQDNFKGLESKPQNALGKWLLSHFFKKHPYEKISMKDLRRTGYDSIKLVHKDPNNYKNVWVSIAPWDSYENFIHTEEQNRS